MPVVGSIPQQATKPQGSALLQHLALVENLGNASGPEEDARKLLVTLAQAKDLVLMTWAVAGLLRCTRLPPDTAEAVARCLPCALAGSNGAGLPAEDELEAASALLGVLLTLGQERAVDRALLRRLLLAKEVGGGASAPE